MQAIRCLKFWNMTKSGRQFALASPSLQILGDSSPLPPWFTLMSIGLYLIMFLSCSLLCVWTRAYRSDRQTDWYMVMHTLWQVALTGPKAVENVFFKRRQSIWPINYKIHNWHSRMCSDCAPKRATTNLAVPTCRSVKSEVAIWVTKRQSYGVISIRIQCPKLRYQSPGANLRGA